MYWKSKEKALITIRWLTSNSDDAPPCTATAYPGIKAFSGTVEQWDMLMPMKREDVMSKVEKCWGCIKKLQWWLALLSASLRFILWQMSWRRNVIWEESSHCWQKEVIMLTETVPTDTRILPQKCTTLLHVLDNLNDPDIYGFLLYWNQNCLKIWKNRGLQMRTA